MDCSCKNLMISISQTEGDYMFWCPVCGCLAKSTKRSAEPIQYIPEYYTKLREIVGEK